MKKEIDDLDVSILKYLEDDARKSLKKLADELNKKTSTIYHRLQRLKSRNFILGYSIIFNPEFLNIGKISLEKIILKPLNISSLDNMFVKSFANFLNTEFQQVLFIALSENSKQIFLISAHITDEDHKTFVENLQKNPYIQNIESEFLSSIIKGQKLFNFNEQWIRKKSRRKHTAEEEGEEESEEEETIEVSLDDDEEMEEADDLEEDIDEDEVKPAKKVKPKEEEAVKPPKKLKNKDEEITF